MSREAHYCFPKFTKSLFKGGALAVANDVAGWEAEFRCGMMEIGIYLGNLGGTSGGTQVDVKVNGLSIFVGAAPSIAFNAAIKRARYAAGALVPSSSVGAGGALTPAFGEPARVMLQPGDYLRVDVLAIPGAASSDLTVTLACTPIDV